jgi:hypothetical protein
MRDSSFPQSIRNLTEARFECTFGRGCEGICCREGEPPIYPDEIARTDANLEKFRPEMRPAARAALEQGGFLGEECKAGQRTLRVVDGWCIFFHHGCIFHGVGAAEGDPFRYKPAACALFPLDRDEHNRWYVRQKDFDGEIWDLFCLDPAQTKVPAAESLREEIALAEKFTADGT